MRTLIPLILVLAIGEVAYASLLQGRTIPLPGDPGAVINADLDQDGNQDLIFIIAKLDATTSVFVLWGDRVREFRSNSEIPMGIKPLESGMRPSMRNTTSRSIVTADFNGDGKVDIGTAAGMALNQGRRRFNWIDLKNKTERSIQAVGLIKISSQNQLVVRVDGGVDACTPESCLSLVRSDILKDNLHHPSEMIVFDFDGDRKLDILAGSNLLDNQNSYLWLGKDSFRETYQLAGVQPYDIQLFDFNHDGRLDLLAQVGTTIIDFPSQTRVFLNRPEGLELKYTLSNFDNHNEPAAVVKNADGCFSYYQNGVDIGFGVMEAVKNSAGECIFETSTPPHYFFKRVSDVTGTGIQCLNLTGEKCYLVVRGPITTVEQSSLWIENSINSFIKSARSWWRP